MRILHAIHDFLPRHRAGSEMYALALGREQGTAHHVTVLCAEYDPTRRHGQVTWRVHEGLPVVELVNNWVCTSFEETYRPPLIGERIEQVLQAVQPDVVHIHNLQNLSFDLPALARARGIPVVATLHDYTLMCPSGGQRIHRAEQFVCAAIDTERCVRCFRESPLHRQASFGRLTAIAGNSGAAGPLYRAGAAAVRRFPSVARHVAGVLRRAPAFGLTRHDVDMRLTAARRLVKDIDLLAAPSRSIAGEFERFGVDPAKLRISDYGFVPLRRVARPADRANRLPLRIGYAGTLVWHKGVHVLIAAARALPAGSYELSIYGDPHVFPDYSAALRDGAGGLPIRFMGAFEPSGAAEAYGRLDVLVVPSLWLENSPLVIHEAFMAGVPVVAARIGGIADLIEEGRTGLLYDPESRAGLEAALRRLIDEPGLLRTLTEGASTIPQIKAIAQDALEWEERYAEVIRGPSPAALAT